MFNITDHQIKVITDLTSLLGVSLPCEQAPSERSDGDDTASNGTTAGVSATYEQGAQDSHPEEVIERTSLGEAQHRLTKVRSIDLTQPGFLRLGEVLRIIPVSRASWYAGVKAGMYPLPVRLGKRTVGWSTSSIRSLLAAFPNATEV